MNSKTLYSVLLISCILAGEARGKECEIHLAKLARAEVTHLELKNEALASELVGEPAHQGAIVVIEQILRIKNKRQAKLILEKLRDKEILGPTIWQVYAMQSEFSLARFIQNLDQR